MQINVVAILAALASIAVATETVYVTVPCSTAHAGAAKPTVASTAVRQPPTPTGSPITHVTGAASMNAVSGSALGMIIAGGVALLF